MEKGKMCTVPHHEGASANILNNVLFTGFVRCFVVSLDLAGHKSTEHLPFAAFPSSALATGVNGTAHLNSASISQNQMPPSYVGKVCTKHYWTKRDEL